MRKSGWLVLIAIAIAGCGGGGGTTVEHTHQATAEADAPSGRRAAERKVRPLRGDSAREEGRDACRGLTPRQAAERFDHAARKAGARRHFVELVADPAPATETSAGYPRLVAALYATTVDRDRQAQAAAGCAEELVAHTGVEKESSDSTG